MVKELRITGYQEMPDAKNGPCTVIAGVCYQNPYASFRGNDTDKRWISMNLCKFDDSCIGKDLYVEYGYKGRVVACQVK